MMGSVALAAGAALSRREASETTAEFPATLGIGAADSPGASAAVEKPSVVECCHQARKTKAKRHLHPQPQRRRQQRRMAPAAAQAPGRPLATVRHVVQPLLTGSGEASSSKKLRSKKLH